MHNHWELNDVHYFVAAAQADSFSAASQDLQQPASTVSRAVTRLEKRLGLSLFRRSSKGLTLTDEGREYLISCRRALRTLSEGAELLQANARHPKGLLKIGCPVTMARDVLAPLLPEFLRRYPDLRLDIEPYASGWDQEGRDDVDIFFKLRAPRDSARRIRVYPGTVRGLFASSAYLKGGGVPAGPDGLVSHRCAGSGVWKLKRGSTMASPAIEFHLVTSDPYVHLRFVQDGLGIAILPLFLARRSEMAGSPLVAVLPQWKPEPITLCALFAVSSRASPKVQALLNFLGEYLGTNRDPRTTNGQRVGLFSDPGLAATSGP